MFGFIGFEACLTAFEHCGFDDALAARQYCFARESLISAAKTWRKFQTEKAKAIAQQIFSGWADRLNALFEKTDSQVALNLQGDVCLALNILGE